jgi:hypothetical protein
MESPTSKSVLWANGVQTTPHELLQALLSWIYCLWSRFLSFFKPTSSQNVPNGSPAAPHLRVIDARSRRAKLLVLPQSDTDNESVEYQLRYRLDDEGDMSVEPEEEDEEDWIVETFKPGTPRNLVSLHERSNYKARARARMSQGPCSAWGPLIKWQTLLAPVNGGADMGSYTWGQNATDVWVTVQIPAEVKSKHVTVVLHPDHLKVSHAVDNTIVAVEGKLPWRVRLLAPDGGSHWEINREAGKASLSIVLEKEKPATNLKWSLWRCMFVGHHEIDTHAMEFDPHIAEILQSLHRQPGSRLDPGEMDADKGQESIG